MNKTRTLGEEVELAKNFVADIKIIREDVKFIIENYKGGE